MENEKPSLVEIVDARIEERLSQLSPRCDFSHMSDDELQQLIKGFVPERSFGAGKKFLLAILDTNGRDGLQSFMKRMEDILILQRRPINPDRDFTKEELSSFRTSRAHIDRRQFVRQLATTVGIGVGAATIAIPPIQLVRDVNSGDQNPHHPSSAAEFAGQVVLTAVPMGAGAVTIARSLNEMNKIRLQQVLEAISELSISAGPNPGKPDSPLAGLRDTMKQPKGPIGRFLDRRAGATTDKPADGQER